MNMRVERKKYLVDNFIEIYENAVPKNICKYFIDFFEKEYKLGNTRKGHMGLGNFNPSWKDCEDLNVLSDKYDTEKH